MNYRFSEIVDLIALQTLMENLWRASGLPVGILDIDGTVLVATGWQKICTDFHRRHPEALQRCRESDAFIFRYLEEGGSQGGRIEYLCKNGLVDVAVPIVIEGRHLATLFLGQFLYNSPDEGFFRSLAGHYSFDDQLYMEALRQVPIFSRERVREILGFYESFVHLLTRLGTEKLQRLETEKALSESEARLRLQNEQLRVSEEKYRLLFSAESDAIIIFDPETLEILEVNEAAVLMYGYSKEEFARLGLGEICEAEATAFAIGETVEGKPVRIPLTHYRRDGTDFPVEISHGSFELRGRRLCVGMIRDISERQRTMRMKDEMLSAVSHEIRTPLTAMIGFAEFLRDNEVERSQLRECLGIIAREGERLKELTDNLLDLQRLRAGFGTENFQPVDVLPLLKSVVLLFSKASEIHQLRLDCPNDLPPLWGDERQLYRALQNLLSNAIKYSPSGGSIQIGGRGDGDFLTLWIKDEGIGIPGEALGQIFDQFFRVSFQDGQRVGGTGLGLALVKAVAQTHRGRVWVESTVGEGSCFFLGIPVCSKP